jgi:hypothetical protein
MMKVPSNYTVEQAEEAASLILFVEYLSYRLETQNLELLKRIIQEFAQGKRKTLLDFIRLGANLIVICPIEISDQKAQEKAQQLLQMNKTQSKFTTRFFSFLHDQVDTRNLELLEMMYGEFLRGKEDTLMNIFVQFAAEVMSIIPSMSRSHS